MATVNIIKRAWPNGTGYFYIDCVTSDYAVTGGGSAEFSGIGDATFQVRSDTNMSPSARYVKVTFSHEGISHTIKIKQLGNEYLILGYGQLDVSKLGTKTLAGAGTSHVNGE